MKNNPVNFLDPFGLFDLPSFLGGWASYEVQKATASLSNTTPPFNPVYEKIDDTIKPISDAINTVEKTVTDHISVSVTARAVSPGSSITATGSSSGVDIGGGLASNLAASLTTDINISLPLSSPFSFSFVAGGSGTPPGWPPFTTAGVDLSWNNNGLTLGLSAGLGVGKPEGHLLVTGNIPSNKCERQGE